MEIGEVRCFGIHANRGCLAKVVTAQRHLSETIALYSEWESGEHNGKFPDGHSIKVIRASALLPIGHAHIVGSRLAEPMRARSPVARQNEFADCFPVLGSYSDFRLKSGA